MTKTDFKTRVRGIFSVRWLKNDGTEGYIHRGILGLNKKVDGQPKEHNDYVLVYKMGNGYGGVGVREWFHRIRDIFFAKVTYRELGSSHERPIRTKLHV